MTQKRILVADDYLPICGVVRRLLEPEYEVIGCVGDGRTLVKTAMELKPDLVVLDLGLPLLNGFAAGRELRKLLPQVKLVYLTMNSDPEIAKRALEIGASGYVVKDSIPEELLPAIKAAFAGPGNASPEKG